jgi:teichuronic acid biosynthesis glycosyltransferase TuaG
MLYGPTRGAERFRSLISSNILYLMPQPLVSVITPAFNAAEYIRETIRSVQAQTLPDWELIVADDLSTDDTSEIVSSSAARDARIRLLRVRNNGGPAAARNLALRHAGGRFVALLDSDDLWLPEKLESQLEFMHKRQSAFSFTKYRFMSEDGGLVSKPIKVTPRVTYSQLVKYCSIGLLTVLIDTQKTGPLSFPECRAEDYVLWLSLLKRGMVADGFDRDLARYRIVPKSLSRNKLRAARWVWSIYRDIEQLKLPQAMRCFAQYAISSSFKNFVQARPRLSDPLIKSLAIDTDRAESEECSLGIADTF